MACIVNDQRKKPGRFLRWRLRIGATSCAAAYRRLIPLLREGYSIEEALKEATQQEEIAVQSGASNQLFPEALQSWHENFLMLVNSKAPDQRPSLAKAMEGWISPEEYGVVVDEESKVAPNVVNALKRASCVASESGTIIGVSFNRMCIGLAAFAMWMYAVQAEDNIVEAYKALGKCIPQFTLGLGDQAIWVVVALVVLCILVPALMVYEALPKYEGKVRRRFDKCKGSIWMMYGKFLLARLLRHWAQQSQHGWYDTILQSQHHERLPRWLRWRLEKLPSLGNKGKPVRFFADLANEMSGVLSSETVYLLRQLQERIDSDASWRGHAARLENCADAEARDVAGMLGLFSLILALVLSGLPLVLFGASGELLGLIRLVIFVISLLTGWRGMIGAVALPTIFWLYLRFG